MRKGSPKSYVIRSITLLLGFLVTSLPILAQSTAFTYQGKLSDSGNPANGNYDLQFKLFDTVTVGTGTQQGSAVTVSSVAVTGGIFTVQLDFGACPTCFDGAARFLEIAVKPTSSGTFTTLGPRQPLSSTPYAIRSLNAVAADGLSVACVNCVTSSQIASVNGSAVTGTIPVASVPAGSANYIQNRSSQQASANFNISGNGVIGGTLGIGTLLPPAGLVHVRGVSPVRILGDTTTLAGAEAVDFFARSSIYGNDLGGMRIQRQVSSGNIDTLLFAAASGNPAAEVMRVSGNGNVGIGTTSPTSKLEVDGGSGTGVVGISSSNGIGVEGASTSGIGVYGTSSTGLAGYFDGRVLIYPASGNGNGSLVIRNRANTNISQINFNDDTNVYRGYLAYIGANAGLGARNDTMEFGSNGKAITFRPNETEVMRLTTDGKVGIGTTNPPSTKLEVDGGTGYGVSGHSSSTGTGVYGGSNSGYGVEGGSNTGPGVYGHSNSGSGVHGDSVNGNAVYGYSWSGYAGYFQGNVYVTGTVTQGSDARLKQNISKLNYGLSEVLRLRPVSWRWKDHPERGQQLGLVAQEVEPVLPELVSTDKDADKMKGLNYTGLLPVLVKAMQEQQQQLEQYRTQLAQQQAREHQQQILVTQQQTQIKQQETEILQQQQQLKRQQGEIEALKKLVCLDHPKAEICQ